jgi:hypothetical protein
MNTTSENSEEKSSQEENSSTTVYILAEDNSVLETRENCSVIPIIGDTIYLVREAAGKEIIYKPTVTARTIDYGKEPGDITQIYCYTDHVV